MSDIHIIIADDEPLARGYIRSLLQHEDDCEIVAECGDAQSTIAAIGEHEPDLVFLDVQMPGRDGFSVLETVGSEAMPYTVFVTAFDRYAIPAFDRHAVDYLLKPFGQERFQEALQRVRGQLALKRDAAWSHKLRDMLESVLGGATADNSKASNSASGMRGRAKGEFVKRVPVKVGNRVVILRAEELEWIEAADCYVNIHRGRETFLLRETLNTLEEQLDPSRFIRIHRGTLVNIEFVQEIRSRSSGDFQVMMKDGKALAISRRRKKDLEGLLGRPF